MIPDDEVRTLLVGGVDVTTSAVELALGIVLAVPLAALRRMGPLRRVAETYDYVAASVFHTIHQTASRADAIARDAVDILSDGTPRPVRR